LQISVLLIKIFFLYNVIFKISYTLSVLKYKALKGSKFVPKYKTSKGVLETNYSYPAMKSAK
jgi:hypothetical protein